MTVAGPPEIEPRADNERGRWSHWKTSGAVRVVVGALVLSVLYLLVLVVIEYAAGVAYGALNAGGGAYDALNSAGWAFLTVFVLSEATSTVIVPIYLTRNWKEGAFVGFLSPAFMFFLVLPLLFVVPITVPGEIGLAALPIFSVYLPFLMPVTTLLALVGGRLGGRRASKKTEVRQEPSPPDNSTATK